MQRPCSCSIGQSQIRRRTSCATSVSDMRTYESTHIDGTARVIASSQCLRKLKDCHCCSSPRRRREGLTAAGSSWWRMQSINNGESVCFPGTVDRSYSDARRRLGREPHLNSIGKPHMVRLGSLPRLLFCRGAKLSAARAARLYPKPDWFA
jgi:hypothetical protein